MIAAPTDEEARRAPRVSPEASPRAGSGPTGSHGQEARRAAGPTGSQEDAVLSVRGLCHRFTRADGTTVTALSRVSLTVSAGEFVCILGRSGPGKTTLLNLIAAFLPTDEG